MYCYTKYEGLVLRDIVLLASSLIIPQFIIIVLFSSVYELLQLITINLIKTK